MGRHGRRLGDGRLLFGGILLIGVIDRLVPSFENPHEMHSVEEMNRRPHDRKLMRMGLE